MTPAARVAAAMDILDRVRAGEAAEQALTRWGRQNRFAGSKDRAAIRDHVFDVMRLRRTTEALGGGDSGRALMIGLLRHQGIDPATLLTGIAHAAAPLSDAEATYLPDRDDGHLDLPDWLLPQWNVSLGTEAERAAKLLRERAPVTLRVNAAKATPEQASAMLAGEGIETCPNGLSPAALTVTEGARRIRQSRAYLDGLVEFQDAASQAVAELLPAAARCLDYCAGGGGKALAMAADGSRTVWAHDIDAGRMSDIPARAARAGTPVTLLSGETLRDQPPFDLVLCDAPCSGSGAWRRAPEGKWRLTADRLEELARTQTDILDRASHLVAKGGWLVYVTCSVLTCENEDTVTAFLADHPGWSCARQTRLAMSKEGDGFFTAHLTRQ